MERLSGIDTVFVHSESRTAHMDVTHVAIFDPSTGGEGLTFDRFKERLAERLAVIPPFHRRLWRSPLGLDRPRWVEDERFLLDDHVHRAALPPPGDEQALAAYASGVSARPLDLNQAPWEMHFVEGVENGLVAVVAKVHHSAIDGLSGITLIARLLDATPEGKAPPADPADRESAPAGVRLIGGALANMVREPFAAARAMAALGRGVAGLAGHAMRAGIGAITLPFGAPTSPFSQRIGPRRSLAFSTVNLADVRWVKDAVGVTVNDVVLALCASALRSYLVERGLRTDRSIVAVVPMSVRTESEHDALGNRLSAMFVPLASDIADPVARLRAIARATDTAKVQERAANYGRIAAELSAAAPPIVGAPAVRLATAIGAVPHLRPGNVMVSNIGGPTFPLYFAGARLLAAYPVGPIVDGVALNITVQTYVDSLCFGLNACPRAVPGVDLLANHIPDALRELTKALAE